MKAPATGSFGAHLKALRDAAGFTQEELATIAGLSVHAVSALERGERRRPHLETVRSLSAALDLNGASRDAFVASARGFSQTIGDEEPIGASLPLPLTSLVGRDAEMQTLRLWLADPMVRLITLIGPGGVGKTRLGLELARTLANDGATRVTFVALAAIQDPQFVPSAIAEALGLANVTAADLPTRARAACGDQPALLVLDNFEQVLDAAPLVADLLISVASLRVLATSRAPLRIRGERECMVGPLGLETNADAISPADLARAPAVRLFVERVRGVRPDFRLTLANGAVVTAICRRLDALPLALELAAPWMKVLDAEELLRRLMHDVLLSTAAPRDLPERQQTMNATVAWSYQLLDPSEQRVFRRLGALPGRFPIDAVAAVLAGAGDEGGPDRSDEAVSAVAGLIDKSLLLRVESPVSARPLYQMLETVRAYAALELVSCGERDDALEALARYYRNEAALAGEGLLGREQGEWLDRVRHELENYRAVMTWLIECGRPADAGEIAAALRYFWLIRGHAAEGLRWYEQILSGAALPPAAESSVLTAAVAMWFAQGELFRGRTALDRALALARTAGAWPIVAEAEYLSGHIDRAAGDETAARAWFASSLDAFRAMNVPSGAGKVLTGMAAIALSSGEWKEAVRLLDEAEAVLAGNAPWYLCFCYWIRALVAVGRGQADEAIGWVRESLLRIRELNDKFALVYALVPLAAGAALKGNDAWAARILGFRDAVADRTGATLVDHSVHDFRAQVEPEVRDRLGPDRWAMAYAAGHNASIDSVLKEIDHARA